jgi:FixJ family two-component response regulator
MVTLKTSKQIASELNISKRTVSRRAEILKLGHSGRKFLFNEMDFDAIKNYERRNASKEKVRQNKISTKTFYGIIKTTETFYIYESKLNSPD